MDLSRNSLAVAIEALSWMAYTGIGERAALFKAVDQIGDIEPSELRQAHKLIMETTRFQNRLEHIIHQTLSEEELKRTPHGITSFLKILTYLKYIENARERELVRNVEFARQILGWQELQPYEKTFALLAAGSIDLKPHELDEYERISIDTCHPKWFVDRLVREFGRNFALAILNRDLYPLPTYVRLNSLTPRNAGQNDSVPSSLHGTAVEGISGVVKFTTGREKLVRSESWASGHFIVQDLASIVAGFVASPKSDSTVLDVCCAPGNKTSHLAALMNDKGSIWSLDISGRRLSQWRIEMKRTHVTAAAPVLADARRIPFSVQADTVIVDPPCSNTGVFARSPDLKWKISPSRMQEYVLRQLSILQATSECVAPAGTLVYCTCSIMPEENEQVIELFLRRNPAFKLVPQKPFLGSPGLRGLELCQRFYPHLNDCNGYFIAKIQRAN
jgi:16S rRNA C967 or C1407 C5-methylase (RsmB/RsmF family)